MNKEGEKPDRKDWDNPRIRRESYDCDLKPIVDKSKMSKEKFYKKQIKGLIMILDDTDTVMIARSYVKEKLNMILNGGIGFSPNIQERLNGMRIFYMWEM